MYLKSIEVHGFKSFANKINFQFHNGITGIVGPNGSGKSNVADAVRWVLGEQRIKQLRGASMQDVIFSGTQLRKPMGYAYVAITLDNRDHQLAIEYEEVTVARRIYRSGESEYLLNATPCRLKDVNELFYDTGIGKEGYSIIGQGQIDRILSGKPEDRRELFDEAAGIVKFKRRKAAAQKKLMDEQQNLLRVTDILVELEKQTEPLEKQSETARIYLKKKEDLKTLDVNVFLMENKRLKEQLVLATEKYGIASEDLTDTSKRYERIKEEYDQIQSELESLNEKIEKSRTELTDTSMLRGRLEGEINVLREQINSLHGSDGHLKNRQSALQTELSGRTQDRDKVLAEKHEVEANLSKVELERREAGEKLLLVLNQMESLNEAIEKEKNDIIRNLNDRAVTRSRMGRFDTMLEQILIRRAELNSRLLRVRSDEAQQEDMIKGLEDEFEQINSHIQELGGEQAVMEELLDQIREELTQKDQKLRDEQVRYHQHKSRLEALANLTERYEGYGGSVRRVMEQKERIGGIIGVAADLFKVDKKYEIAIETALGGSIQNVVTKDEATAKQMISYLKQNKAGRVTFLPLTSIRRGQQFQNRELLNEEGVLGMADSLVEIDSEYRDVAAFLLGRIVVVDHVDHATALAKKYKHSLRIVTLEGELLTPGGAISGGAFKNSSNLLGRRREMEDLESNVHKTLKGIDSLLEEIEKAKQLRAQKRLELEELKKTLQSEFIRQNTARMNVEAARAKKDEAEQGVDELRLEQQEIAVQIEEIKANKEQIRSELQASETWEKETEHSIQSKQKELEVCRQEETECSKQSAYWDLEAGKIQQKLSFEKMNLDRIQGEISRYAGELQEVKEQLSANAADVSAKETDILNLQQTIENYHISHTDEEKKLKADVERREIQTARQKNFFSDREALSERMSALDKEVYRLEAQKEKLEEAVELQINYMWDEYEITLSDAATLRNETLTDLAYMKKEIVSLKDQIRKLGDVNVNAIEDYRNLMERFTFLKTQHDDLIAAEETLQGIISELDAAMRKQFREKFAEICSEFDKVFRELFGGGKGTLELMEDEDILEAGIRIIAQPPGKKLQNMMQLSGGEKALTAISLLFAIQNLKPSPFCLLDEIEAALDDSNVGRFANYLHKLTRYTQFIVITHRRGTMEKADRLYGITMQEKGISALVSVSLIDKDLK